MSSLIIFTKSLKMTYRGLKHVAHLDKEAIDV